MVWHEYDGQRRLRLRLQGGLQGGLEGGLQDGHQVGLQGGHQGVLQYFHTQADLQGKEWNGPGMDLHLSLTIIKPRYTKYKLGKVLEYEEERIFE